MIKYPKKRYCSRDESKVDMDTLIKDKIYAVLDSNTIEIIDSVIQKDTK